MSKVRDLTGKRFGRLTVVKIAPEEMSMQYAQKKILWVCRCDCGKETAVMGQALVSGNTRSCGCLRSETNSKNLRAFWAKMKGETN